MLSQTQCSVRHNAQSDTMLSQTQHPSRHNAQSDWQQPDINVHLHTQPFTLRSKSQKENV